MGSILIYGGTFDPVHNGHKNAFLSACKLVSPRLCIIIPNSIPPHKQAQGLASGTDRINMLRLTFGDSDNIIYSDYELTREGKSYSLYTLRHFKEQYPDDDLYFAIGSDSLLTFHKWYEYRELLKLTSLLCVSREDGDRGELEKAKASLEADGGHILIADAKPIEVSSSEIRKKLKLGEDCSCYLDENVVKYIMDNNLYKEDTIDR
ncbi:MAG: nicotinate (nicotinamide) nucleotide adenylyltransferase [Ruminococcus sp.]|nr:nicotinate (nicotinamide) nucleotide adenylyltransferase [Ruminococcus sp.]